MSRWGRVAIGRAAVVVLLVLVVVVGVGVGVGAPVAGAAGGAFRFSSEMLDAGEGQGFVRVVVERTDLPVSRATIAFRTVAGTATEREDFEATEGVLTFDVGVTSASFVVVIRNDAVEEPTEQLTAVLGERWAVAGTAVIRIFDDDRRPAGAASSGEESASVASGSGASPSMGGASSMSGSGSGSGSGSAVGGVRSSASAGVPSAPGTARAVARTRASGPAVKRRVAVRQSPVTPFELRPSAPTEVLDPSLPLAIDPVLAVAAALLLARVAAEVWFRLRTGVA
jgi:hypothetical protein